MKKGYKIAFVVLILLSLVSWTIIGMSFYQRQGRKAAIQEFVTDIKAAQTQDQKDAAVQKAFRALNSNSSPADSQGAGMYIQSISDNECESLEIGISNIISSGVEYQADWDSLMSYVDNYMSSGCYSYAQ